MLQYHQVILTVSGFKPYCFLLLFPLAPAPSNVQTVIGKLCLDFHNQPKEAWFNSLDPAKCNSTSSLDDKIIEAQQITANQIVFAFQFPLPRDNMDLEMSRWFQNIVSVLHPEIEYKKGATSKCTCTSKCM